MRTFLVLAICVIGTANAFLSIFDLEACTTLPDLPTPRVINATIPQVFDTPGFNFSDPDGSVYPPNTQCEWQIFMDEPEPELVLSFFNFSLEYVTDCRTDRVEVYEGTDDTGTLLRTLCGNLGSVVPEPIVTTSLNLFVRFVSDGNGIERTGFLARAGNNIVNTACDGTGPMIFDSTGPGFFETFNYPVNYENNELCEYLFQAPAGQRVVVGFQDFVSEDVCSLDYLQVFDGGSQASSMVGQFYGDNTPGRMTSSSNELYLRFVSDSSVNFEGFRGFYRFE